VLGEIRDSETAKIALNAALTGHLVLTTLHTNNAAGAIPRLLEMGIEPFLLAGSINLIVAQRLVRRLCPYCTGKKCLRCRKLGYHGRIAVAEALKPLQQLDSRSIQTREPAVTFDATGGRDAK
jgi:type II secretory ATPase GspE/PulE/Tfp pilus assembly ATPase PilB-like protein